MESHKSIHTLWLTLGMYPKEIVQQQQKKKKKNPNYEFINVLFVKLVNISF